MSKRKGLSADEKKQRMLQLFYEKKDFFQLKELEKIAPKEKGIISQSVKEVIQCLVDDGLVDSEKIGTSIYFWAFPSKAKHAKKKKLSDLQSKIETSKNDLRKCEESITAAMEGREESPHREEVLILNKKLKEENKELRNQLQVYKDSDPEMYEKMKSEMKSLKEETNRHTDNILTFISWCKNKFNCEEETLYKQFDIPSDLDYIEEEE